MTTMPVDVCWACKGQPLLFTCPVCKAAQVVVVDTVSTGAKADPEYALFRDACRHDGYTHGGFVSQNRVRAAMSNEHGLTVNPRRYSGFWRRAQLDRTLSAAVSEEPSTDRRGKNLNKKSKIHRWLGTAEH